MDAAKSPHLLTVKEAADAIRVSKDSIYRRIESGELPARRIGRHGPLRIERDELDRLLRPAGPQGGAA
jgi:excisionase family DNA binding protein